MEDDDEKLVVVHPHDGRAPAKKRRVTFADSTISIIKRVKTKHSGECAKMAPGTISFDSILDFKTCGFLCLRESVEMQMVGVAAVNSIGNFLSYMMTGDHSLGIDFNHPKRWSSVSPQYIGHDGYLALHFHPYILRYIVLSHANYITTNQLGGSRVLHTMLEGCRVRIPGSQVSRMRLEADLPSSTFQVRSLYVLMIDCNEYDNGGPEFLANFEIYSRLVLFFFQCKFVVVSLLHVSCMCFYLTLLTCSPHRCVSDSHEQWPLYKANHSS